MMKKIAFVALLLSVSILSVEAQYIRSKHVPYGFRYFNPDLSNLTFHLGGGFGAYYGDLSGPLDFDKNNSTLNTNYNLGFTYQFTHYIAFRVEYAKFQLQSEDHLERRGLSFATTNNRDISFQVVHGFLPRGSIDTKETRFYPYAYIGLGVGWVNTFTPGDFQEITDGADSTGSKMALVIPYGIGVDYYIKPNLSVGFDLGFRQSTSDYIDGVSKRANSKFPSLDGYLLYGLRIRYTKSYGFNYSSYSKKRKHLQY